MTSVTPTGGSAAGMTYTGLGQNKRLTAGNTSFVDDMLGLEQATTGSTTTSFTRTPDGTIVGETRGGTNYYFLFDALGSVVGVVGSSGSSTPVETFGYTPYGKATCQSGRAACTSRSASPAATRTASMRTSRW